LDLRFAIAVGATGFALAKDADDEKVPAAEVTKIEETLSTLGCSGYESVKKEEQGIYEIEDAKCKMQARQGLHRDPDLALLITAAYVSRKTGRLRAGPSSFWRRAERASARAPQSQEK